MQQGHANTLYRTCVIVRALLQALSSDSSMCLSSGLGGLTPGPPMGSPAGGLQAGVVVMALPCPQHTVPADNSLSASHMELTVKLLRTRLQSRLALHKQFSSLGECLLAHPMSDAEVTDVTWIRGATFGSPRRSLFPRWQQGCPLFGEGEEGFGHLMKVLGRVTMSPGPAFGASPPAGQCQSSVPSPPLLRWPCPRFQSMASCPSPASASISSPPRSSRAW